MHHKRHNQNGFGHVELFFAVFIVAVVAFVGVRALHQSKAAYTLAWAPPTLTSPTTITISNTNRSVNLDTTKDYIVKMPSTPITAKGGVVITGGHNVVLIGGEIRQDTNYNVDPGKDQRGLYLQKWTGTMHVEGLWISGTQLGEGIDIGNANPNTTLQIENVRIETVHGSYATNHADVIQNWGGPVTYRIDHLSGSSTYQGFFVQSTKFGPMTQLADFRYVNLNGANNLGKYLFYNATGLTTSNVKLTEVYSNPQTPGTIACGCYPEKDPVWSAIKHGMPANGDFVPVGVAGTGYKSPGYGSTPTSPTPPPPTPTPTGPVTVVNEPFTTTTALQPVSGTWALNNGTYGIKTPLSSNSGNANIAISPVVITGDYTLSADALTVGTSGAFDDFSIIFNYADANNYYYASFNESNDTGTNGIFKFSSGVMTELKDFTPLIKSDTVYKIKVVKSGSTYTVSNNGTTVGSVSDTTFASGKVGFGTRNNAATFDNLLVTQP